ncbi:hypothetical protein N9979_00185 [bacterium]|nr:hypothetical protein [bacterium]
MKDLYFQSEWISLHCLEEGAEGLAFVYQEGDQKWFYPFVRRQICAIGQEDVSERGLSDIESAYGYGGPIASTSDGDFLKRARLSLERWCREEKIVAEFMRFHPILETEKLVGSSEFVTVIDDRETVAINSSEGYSKNAAYMIRRGRKAGYGVIEAPLDQFSRFVTMYRETMEMLGATDYYHFNSSYFSDLEKLVKAKGRLLAVVEEGGDEWVSSGIFLDGEVFSHYHLSASITTRRVPGATNLLLDHAAQIARAAGKSFLHLGGGRTSASDDSLLKFKKEMGAEQFRFHIGKCVHLQNEYDQLVASWEKQGGISRGNPVLLRYRQSI